MSDDEYRGYHIPEGCMIMPNIWSVTMHGTTESSWTVCNPVSSCRAMSRDERYYDEPEAFRPERYLNEDGRLMADDRELPHSYVFGFGRR